MSESSCPGGGGGWKLQAGKSGGKTVTVRRDPDSKAEKYGLDTICKYKPLPVEDWEGGKGQRELELAVHGDMAKYQAAAGLKVK